MPFLGAMARGVLEQGRVELSAIQDPRHCVRIQAGSLGWPFAGADDALGGADARGGGGAPLDAAGAFCVVVAVGLRVDARIDARVNALIDA